MAASYSSFHAGHVILPCVVACEGEIADGRTLGGAQGVAAGYFTVDGVGDLHHCGMQDTCLAGGGPEVVKRVKAGLYYLFVREVPEGLGGGDCHRDQRAACAVVDRAGDGEISKDRERGISGEVEVVGGGDVAVEPNLYVHDGNRFEFPEIVEVGDVAQYSGEGLTGAV